MMSHPGLNFCADHWARLRAAIDARGLGVLVSESGDEAREKLAAYHEDGPSIDNFDPLLVAYLTICEGCVQMAGLQLVAGAPTGEFVCPLCRANFLHDAACENGECKGKPFDSWIETMADRMVDAWKAIGAG